jgi:hypothetical protein
MRRKKWPGTLEVPGRLMPLAGFDLPYMPRKVAEVVTVPLEAVKVLGESE